MCSSDVINPHDWVPSSCTLPTAEQPVRVAEFDELLTDSVRWMDRTSPTTLRLGIVAAAEDRARDLALRESACCSFFRFDFASESGNVSMSVTVPPGHVAVLDAFAALARPAGTAAEHEVGR